VFVECAACLGQFGIEPAERLRVRLPTCTAGLAPLLLQAGDLRLQLALVLAQLLPLGGGPADLQVGPRHPDLIEQRARVGPLDRLERLVRAVQLDLPGDHPLEGFGELAEGLGPLVLGSRRLAPLLLGQVERVPQVGHGVLASTRRPGDPGAKCVGIMQSPGADPGALSDRDGPVEERLGVGILALLVIHDSQAVQTIGHVGVLRPQRLYPDRQRPPVEQLGLGVAALSFVDVSQSVEVKGYAGVLLPQRLLRDRLCPLEERLGLGVAALFVVDVGKIVDANGRVGVLWPQHLLVDRHRPPVERLGLGVASLGHVQRWPDRSGYWPGWDAPALSPSP